MSFFGVLGLAGLYARQAKKTGWLGLVGYILLTFWLVLIMGFSFVEAFILPHVATTSPAFVKLGWERWSAPPRSFTSGPSQRYGPCQAPSLFLVA